jgi:molecular chaperone Hsp33
MQEKDYLLKIIDQDQNIRLFLANTSHLVEEAHRRHDTSATASAALGRVLTAAVMMGSDLKGETDLLTLRIHGDGPAGTILATADSKGGVRGLISEPQADLPSRSPGKLAVGELVGQDGFLEVIKDLGLKQPFEGKVPLVSGEIAEDLAQYFMMSEQIPALVSLGVLVGPDLHIQAAGGLIIQALPGATDEVLEIIENNVLILGNISQLILDAARLEDLVPLIMQGIPYSILARRELAFHCSCSRERLGAVLASLGEEELGQALEDGEPIEAVCNFCKEKYSFSPEEIQALKSKKP